MNKYISFLAIIPFTLQAQTYHPAPGNVGTNAIHKDSSCFIGWATGGTIQRGFIDINDTTQTASGLNKASFGTLEMAFGPATGDFTDIVSLGDSGIVILTFDHYLYDGPGYDFAVFENGFSDNYMEFAHVEISSDGIHFIRIPSISEVQTSVQLNNASFSDCRMVNNLAGKYRVGYGTPFDIQDAPDDINLDKNNIRYIKLIDAIGNVGSEGYTTDSQGTKINDPYPTPFESCGFDLEAVGVIHGVYALSISENTALNVALFPNPCSSVLTISCSGKFNYTLLDLAGKKVLSGLGYDSQLVQVTNMQKGSYIVQIESNGFIQSQIIIIQ